jgi:thiol-disulfide isomerase/thioredoxin
MVVYEVKTKREFDELMVNCNKEYIFCDFYADWCGPCKKIKQWLENTSLLYSSNIYFVKLNVDNNDLDSIIEYFNVTSIPTFITLKRVNINSYEQVGYSITGIDYNKINSNLQKLETIFSNNNNEDF